jgi:hypothetical protein
MSGVMDINFYANEAGNAWTSTISGLWQGIIPEGWNLPMEGGEVAANLVNGTWTTEGEWHADVIGTYGSSSITGEAAGRHQEDGTFSGMGGGTWQGAED